MLPSSLCARGARTGRREETAGGATGARIKDGRGPEGEASREAGAAPGDDTVPGVRSSGTVQRTKSSVPKTVQKEKGSPRGAPSLSDGGGDCGQTGKRTHRRAAVYTKQLASIRTQALPGADGRQAGNFTRRRLPESPPRLPACRSFDCAPVSAFPVPSPSPAAFQTLITCQRGSSGSRASRPWR